MTLTDSDKQILLKNGYEQKDLKQIQEAVNISEFRLYDKTITEMQGYYRGSPASIKISAEQAYELLGQETFLSGIGRSSFHWGSSREIEGTESRYSVSFDSETMFSRNPHPKHRDNPNVSVEAVKEWKEEMLKKEEDLDEI